MTAIVNDAYVDAARTLAAPVFSRGAAFMFDPTTVANAKEQGYANGFAFYFAGRGGVLGDVSGRQVASAFAFFEPDLVVKMWERGTADRSAAQCATDFADACTAWGRANLADLDGVDRLAMLARAVADGVAAPMGLSLFTGWREVHWPDDGPGAAALGLQVLRELRGDLHIHAVAAAGLTAVEAVVAHGGAERAEQFGWRGDLPEQDDVRGAWEAAEATTDRLMAAALTVLDDGSRADLVELVTTIDRHLG
ncbi:MAG: hypothetical protein S0880_04815 [Actinomycetota bacterium]|nr:hypothetical protein [Actinomycetota bacterium]